MHHFIPTIDSGGSMLSVGGVVVVVKCEFEITEKINEMDMNALNMVLFGTYFLKKRSN